MAPVTCGCCHSGGGLGGFDSTTGGVAQPIVKRQTKVSSSGRTIQDSLAMAISDSVTASAWLVL